jgi:hypothetical protein
MDPPALAVEALEPCSGIAWPDFLPKAPWRSPARRFSSRSTMTLRCRPDAAVGDPRLRLDVLKAAYPLGKEVVPVERLIMNERVHDFSAGRL